MAAWACLVAAPLKPDGNSIKNQYLVSWHLIGRHADHGLGKNPSAPSSQVPFSRLVGAHAVKSMPPSTRGKESPFLSRLKILGVGGRREGAQPSTEAELCWPLSETGFWKRPLVGLIRRDSFPHTSSQRSHLPDTLEADSTSGHRGVTYFLRGGKAFACVLPTFQLHIYELFFTYFDTVLFQVMPQLLWNFTRQLGWLDQESLSMAASCSWNCSLHQSCKLLFFPTKRSLVLEICFSL